MATRGIRNNNPLNIRRGSKWIGMTAAQTDTEFCQFQSMTFGVRAAVKLITSYISGANAQHKAFNTVQAIISRWAPDKENNTESYVNFVSNRSGLNRFYRIGRYDKDAIFHLVAAMAKYESGFILNRPLFDSAWAML